MSIQHLNVLKFVTAKNKKGIYKTFRCKHYKTNELLRVSRGKWLRKIFDVKKQYNGCFRASFILELKGWYESNMFVGCTLMNKYQYLTNFESKFSKARRNIWGARRPSWLRNVQHSELEARCCWQCRRLSKLSMYVNHIMIIMFSGEYYRIS